MPTYRSRDARSTPLDVPDFSVFSLDFLDSNTVASMNTAMSHIHWAAAWSLERRDPDIHVSVDNFYSILHSICAIFLPRRKPLDLKWIHKNPPPPPPPHPPPPPPPPPPPTPPTPTPHPPQPPPPPPPPLGQHPPTSKKEKNEVRIVFTESFPRQTPPLFTDESETLRAVMSRPAHRLYISSLSTCTARPMSPSLFQFARKIRSPQSNSKMTVNHLSVAGTLYSDPVHVADALNEQFIGYYSTRWSFMECACARLQATRRSITWENHTYVARLILKMIFKIFIHAYEKYKEVPAVCVGKGYRLAQTTQWFPAILDYMKNEISDISMCLP